MGSTSNGTFEEWNILWTSYYKLTKQEITWKELIIDLPDLNKLMSGLPEYIREEILKDTEQVIDRQERTYKEIDSTFTESVEY